MKISDKKIIQYHVEECTEINGKEWNMILWVVAAPTNHHDPFKKFKQ